MTSPSTETWDRSDEGTPSISIEDYEQNNSLNLYRQVDPMFDNGPQTSLRGQSPYYSENPFYLTALSNFRSTHGGSDSSSDCQSISSGQSSPSNSPNLSPQELPYTGTAELDSSITNLDLDNPDNPTPSSFSFYLSPPAALSANSLTPSTDSSGSFSGNPISSLDYSSSPQFPQPSIPVYSISPGPSPVLVQPASNYGPDQVPHDILPYYCQINLSSVNPSLDEPYLGAGSASSDNVYAHQRPSSFPHSSEYQFNHESHYLPPSQVAQPGSSSSSAIDIPEIMEYAKDVTEGLSRRDARDVQHELINHLSSGGGGGQSRLEVLFSRPPKDSVSTQAGRRASEKRRKHPGRFACTFSECGATFTRKLGLDNHFKSHLGIADQQCEFCLKRFGNSLKRHMKRCKQNPNHEKKATKKMKTDVIC